MAPKWGELIQSEEFQSLDDSGKEIFRENYFQQAVVPEIPEGVDHELVRSNFDEKTKTADIEYRQQKYEEETGVGERLGMRLKGGYKDVLASASASAMVGLQGDIEKLNEKEKIVADYESGLGLPEDSFAQQLMDEDPARFAAWIKDSKAEIPKKKAFLEKRKSQSFQRMRRLSKEAGEIPRAPVSEAVMKAKSFDEAIELASIDPVSFIAEVGVRSLPMMMLPVVKGVVGGAIFGPVGFAAGMGSGSFTVERAASLNGAMIEKLQGQGVDINSEAAVMKAISEPEFFEEMKQDANTRGLIIGYFDALSGGLATKTLAPAAMKKGITKELLNVAAQMPLQAGAGGAGEAAAQAATGEELKAGEILAEMAGELVQTPGDIAVATLAGVRERTKSDVNNVVNGDEKLKQRRADLDAKAEEYRQAEVDGVGELELEARKEEIMEDTSKFMEDVDSSFAKYEEEERMIKGLEQELGQEKIQAAQKAKAAAAIERDVAEYEGRPAMVPPTKVPSVGMAVKEAVAEEKKKEVVTDRRETQMQKALREAAAQVDTSPTEAQKESGNYKKGHVSVQGLPVAIENPKGSTREGEDEGGQKWTQKMQSHYGYIKKSEGADGDHVDVFLNANAPTADKVFVVNQNNPYTGKFDEHKVIIGPATMDEANQEYLSNYAEDWAGLESTVEMSMPEFKQWLKGDTTKPVVQADVAKITPKITPAMAPRTEEAAVAEPKLSKKARAPRRELKGKARYRNAAGDLTGAPQGIKTPQKRTGMVGKMVRLMESDLAQAPETFEWYDNSGKAIMAAANNDKKVAENIVRLFAFYSQANSLGGNTTAAVKSIYEIARGNMEPRAGRFPNRTKKYIKGILEAKEFTTKIPGIEDKLMNFYRNLHDSTFDTNLFDEAATQDRWMLRLFGYEEKGDGVRAGKAQYDFAHDLNIDITDAYNKKHGTKLLPREAQAALWFYARNIAGKEKAEAAGKEFKIPAVVDFAHYLNRATEVVTWESVPSVGSGILPGIHYATEAQKAEYNDAIYSILVDAEGNDTILKKLGAQLSRTDQGMGSFELAINPNFITKIVADKETGIYNREVVDLYANIIGVIMTQDAVPWHRADPTLTGKKAAVGYEITAEKPFTEKMAQQFYNHVNTIMPGAEFSMINGNLRFINFRNEDGKPLLISDPKYRANISTIVDTFTGFDIIDVADFKAEGEYYANDWETNQEGQEYQDQIREAGRSDILEWVRGRRNAVQGINRDFAKRYGWSQAPEQTVSAPVPLSRLTDSESAQQEIYGRFGTLNRDMDTTEDLKIYNLDNLIADPVKVDSLMTEYQYEVKYFSFHEDPAAGVAFTVPKLKKEHYGTGVLWIHDPRVAHESFKDVEYTRQWRIVHEMGHGITEQIMQDRYGDSRREGRMGRSWDATRGHPSKRQVTVELNPLTLLEAQRSVEWEDVSFRVQRMLMEDMMIHVKPEDFGREYNTNIADATHRVLTGDFGDPGEYGFVPSESLPSIKSILSMLEKTEKSMAKEQGRDPSAGLSMETYERFTQDELRAEMAKQRKVPMLRKGAVGKVTVAQLTEHVSHLTNRWKNAPQIHAVENYTKLPSALKHYVETQQAEEEIDGLYDPGTNTVYLVADGISNTDHATKVIFHEVMGHAGIRATFGNDAIPLLKAVFKAKREAMSKVALDYGLDLSKPADQLVAAEEWLAMKAETSPKDSWVRRLISFIKTQLRRLFDLKITDTEILGALGRMRGTIENGEGLWNQAVAVFPMLSRSQEPFYSQMESVLGDKLPGKGTGSAYADTIKAFVKKGVIKSEEVEWSGVIEWLSDQKAKITKADVLNYVKANKIEVQETTKGEADGREHLKTMFDVFEEGDSFYIGKSDGEMMTDAYGDPVKFNTEEEAWASLEYDYLDEDEIPDGTKYHDYQMPGGKNYREVLLQLPRKDIDYVSLHYDEKNILAHIRMNERIDIDGKRVLFLEEVQSDWGQQLRKDKIAVSEAVNNDFDGIVKRMIGSGVLKVVC